MPVPVPVPVPDGRARAVLWSAEFAVHTTRSFHRGGHVFHLKAMVRVQVQDGQWTKIEAVLASQRAPKNNRNFIEAVLWWRRTGVPWRDLPDEFGPWKTVFNRFDRWSKTGKWTRLFQALQTDRDTSAVAWTAPSTALTSTLQEERGAAAQG